MNKIIYEPKKMNMVKKQVQRLIEIVKELESEFPGRHFTLDGHLIGSIGEVMAAYYYGIELYNASTKVHDGEINGEKVQIKISQQDNIAINYKPDYLIVLYLNKNGNIYEVYNGTGKLPWENATKKRITINKLMQLDKNVPDYERIPTINKIRKMSKEYKNK